MSRSQNVAYVMTHDWAAIAQFLAPALQRIDDASTDLQLLVITSSDEAAAAVAASAVKLLEGKDLGVVAATSARRASRLLASRSAQVVASTPDTLLELVRGAAIKLDTVRTVVLAWADELVALGALDTLETLMAELPKDSVRVVVASELTPGVDTLIERYARRARRVVAPPSDADQPRDLEIVTVSAPNRLEVLRRLLDSLDPRSAMVFAREGENETRVRDLLSALGYRGPEAPIVVGRAAAPGTELVVLFDLPASREELREAAGAAARAVALAQPSQRTSLRTLAGGGALKPLTLPESALRARSRDAQLRDALRSVLQQAEFGRELLALEPLLDEFDGIEIAAAAVRLLESERAASAEAAATLAAAKLGTRDRTATGDMVRLFITIGARDGARPGDLVGAIANEANISSSEVGKIDVRESHSVVEVSASVADTVIERVNGTSIKGRRAVVRRDEGPKREGGARGDSGRPRRDGGRPRGGERGGPPSRGPRRGAPDSTGPRRPRAPRSEDRE